MPMAEKVDQMDPDEKIVEIAIERLKDIGIGTEKLYENCSSGNFHFQTSKLSKNKNSALQITDKVLK